MYTNVKHKRIFPNSQHFQGEVWHVHCWSNNGNTRQTKLQMWGKPFWRNSKTKNDLGLSSSGRQPRSTTQAKTHWDNKHNETTQRYRPTEHSTRNTNRTGRWKTLNFGCERMYGNKKWPIPWINTLEVMYFKYPNFYTFKKGFRFLQDSTGYFQI